MLTTGPAMRLGPGGRAVPDLDFRVEGAAVAEYAAAPSLLLALRIDTRGGEEIRSIALNAQVRIASAQRHYTAEERARLCEVFGEERRWGETLKSLLWANAAVQVPAFSGSTRVDLPVPCTYDFEVVSAKYFHALLDGQVPLELLFSGTMFYAGSMGLQVAQIPWDKEARFRLPVALYKQMMDHYFPNRDWVRLHRDTFDRLAAYRARAGLPTWEAALERLLGAAEEGQSA
jgi:hypothetical protein